MGRIRAGNRVWGWARFVAGLLLLGAPGCHRGASAPSQTRDGAAQERLGSAVDALAAAAAAQGRAAEGRLVGGSGTAADAGGGRLDVSSADVVLAASDSAPALPLPSGPPIDLLHAVPAVVVVSSALHGDPLQVRRLVDGDPTTAWNSESGDLVGAWIAFRVPADARVSAVAMTAGHLGRSRVHDLFTANHRIRRVRLVREGQVVAEGELDQERREVQVIPVDGAGGEWRIEVVEVQPGTQRTWRELCVGELRVLGHAPGEVLDGSTPVAAIGSFPSDGRAESGPEAGDLAEWASPTPFGCTPHAVTNALLLRADTASFPEDWGLPEEGLAPSRFRPLPEPARRRVPPMGEVFLPGVSGLCRPVVGLPGVVMDDDGRVFVHHELSGCGVDLAPLALVCPAGRVLPRDLRWTEIRWDPPVRVKGDLAETDPVVRELREIPSRLSASEREAYAAMQEVLRAHRAVEIRRVRTASFAVGDRTLRFVEVQRAYFEPAADGDGAGAEGEPLPGRPRLPAEPDLDQDCPLDEFFSGGVYLADHGSWTRVAEGSDWVGVIHDGRRILALVSKRGAANAEQSCSGAADCLGYLVHGRTSDSDSFLPGAFVPFQFTSGDGSWLPPALSFEAREPCLGP